MQTFRFPLFRRSASTIMPIRRNSPSRGKDRIEVDTRGGDDKLHGGFIVRARNSVFDARNPLADEKLPFSREGYEANLSGPIVRKKLWFFLDANDEQQQQSQPVLAYLPSGMLRTDALSPVARDRFLGLCGASIPTSYFHESIRPVRRSSARFRQASCS